MCQNTHRQIVKKSRHRFERLLFILSAIVTFITFFIAFAMANHKDSVAEVWQEFAVSEYRAAHPDSKKTDAEVLEALDKEDKETIDKIKSLEPELVLLAPAALLLFMIYQIGLIYGGARSGGVKVGPQQFGEVHAMWVEMAQKLGMKKIPELYILNGNGALNAFATCLPGYRSFGAIYSDILERALANGDEESLRFVLGHELGHIRLKHVSWWYFLLSLISHLPGLNFFIGLPLSRAREYGCDKVGLYLSGDHECKGLRMLAAGKHLYRKVNLEVYEKEQIHTRSFWVTVHNFFADHPVISWRIAALRQQRHGDVLFPKKYRNIKNNQ